MPNGKHSLREAFEKTKRFKFRTDFLDKSNNNKFLQDIGQLYL